jgi:hypothetical protein
VHAAAGRFQSTIKESPIDHESTIKDRRIRIGKIGEELPFAGYSVVDAL